MNKQYDNFSDFTNAVAALNYFNAETVKQSTSPVCVATILVRFSAFKSVAGRDALIEFIKRLFDGAEPFYEGTATETRMYFYDRNADESDRINALLDKCVILNTYFKDFSANQYRNLCNSCFCPSHTDTAYSVTFKRQIFYNYLHNDISCLWHMLAIDTFA